MSGDGQARREAIRSGTYTHVLFYVPELTHAVCGGATVEGVDNLRRLITEASGGTPDGRWMVGDVLVNFLGENLNRRGVHGTVQVMAYIAAYGSAPPGFTASGIGAAFEGEMAMARRFVEATLRDDFDAAMALTDEFGDRLLFMLASLVAVTCPLHRPAAG